MPSSKTGATTAAEPSSYTIWFAGETRSGTAKDLLDGIRSDAGGKSEPLRRLSTEKYANLIISDASFFLPEDLLAFLRSQPYLSDYDRALRYLSEMPSSGVRILKNG
jgi:hypothetical protein